MTHDGDTVVSAVVRKDTVKLYLGDTVTYSLTQVGPNTVLPSLPPDSSAAFCNYERYSTTLGRFACVDSSYVRSSGSYRFGSWFGVSSVRGSVFLTANYSTLSNPGASPGFL